MFQMTALETAKSPMPRMVHFFADDKLPGISASQVPSAGHETNMQSAARYSGADLIRHLYTVTANLNLII